MSTVKDKSRLPNSEGWYAFIEETGERVGPGHNWQYIKQLVGAYLDKRGLNVGDREQYLHSAVCKDLARSNKSGMCIEPYRISAAQTKTRGYESDRRIPSGLRGGKPGYDGKAWGVWHLAAADGKLDAKFANELVRRIGCGACRSHATRYLQTHPINGDPFRWTVDFHNSVNSKIGKPIVSYEKAKETWKI